MIADLVSYGIAISVLVYMLHLNATVRAERRRLQQLRERVGRGPVAIDDRSFTDLPPDLGKRAARLWNELCPPNARALAQMIGSTEAAHHCRRGLAAQFYQDSRLHALASITTLADMADRVRGNRQRLEGDDFVQLVEAVVRHCAERLEIFPLEATCHE